ncbi:hypothetical protein [Methylobacterium goesingense]|uniref:Uncharacterized protein n=1 Tax=Methylobacterium goesingense TaxID=243690 RepID=A0ABV2L9R5_9HYPH|nr:hypothetical protein [Methylobacterium goesingense]GJD74120.1 hypothetical protein CFIICLFH_2353 [Methylobacterium goesingense]
MSAVNIIRARDAVHMLTDGAAFDGGKLAFTVAKVWPVPHLNAAIAMSGPWLQAPMLFADLTLAATTFR